MHRYRPFSRATWSIYLFLLVFRVFIALSPGYIHPDEFFQSAEITAGNIFDLDVNIPWEYRPELPCRSILIPAITTGIPFVLLKAWIGNDADHYITSRALFITQRLAFVLISLIIDWAIVRMARQIRRSPSIALLLVSSSYVTLAYHTHPFSNTVETVILALCATVLSNIIQDHESSVMTALPPSVATGAVSSATTAAEEPAPTGAEAVPRPTPMILSFALGMLFSVGVFTRITFVIYGFPLGIMFLYLNLIAAFQKDRSIVVGVGQFILACTPLALGLASMSAVAVLIDSIYFGKLIIYNAKVGMRLSLSDILITHPKDWGQLSYNGSLTLTMWNNLRYNLDEKNLAEHGLHPRFFHLLLNFPVLFGNLALIAATTLVQKIRARQWSSQSKLVTALTYSGICGISLLSSMPHQEARFLTPLILPLIVALSGRISKLGRKFWPLWLLGNGIMALVLGLLHQAGVMPAMDIIQQQALGFQGCREVFSGSDSGSKGHMLCFTYPSEPAAPLLCLPYSTILIAPSTVDFSDQDFYDSRTQVPRHANFDHIDIMVKKPTRAMTLNIFYL
ncbi:alpha 1,2 mannosyltransferase [Mortierella sp. GBA30]|nr:alpha 1,2 mannosyltransferase [Mortierella sp. GBA30]